MIAIVGLTRTQRQLCDSAWPGLDWLYLYTLCHPHGTRAPSRLWQVTHTKNITNTPWNPFVLLFSYMVYMAYIVSAEHFAAFHIIFYVIWGFLFNLIPRLSACPPVRPFARSGFMALSTFYLSHTCVYFLQSVFALLVLYLDFLFVLFRCVDCSLISCVCFCVRCLSLSRTMPVSLSLSHFLQYLLGHSTFTIYLL